MTIARSISGVFCDDIRREVTGKFTLVGCYAGALVLDDWRKPLQKLCILVRLNTPASEPFKDVRILVLKNDEVLINVEVPVPVDESSDDSSEPEDGLMQDLLAQFEVGPIKFDGPSWLKVRAVLDGKEVRGLALAVEGPPVPSN